MRTPPHEMANVKAKYADTEWVLMNAFRVDIVPPYEPA